MFAPVSDPLPLLPSTSCFLSYLPSAPRLIAPEILDCTQGRCPRKRLLPESLSLLASPWLSPDRARGHPRSRRRPCKAESWPTCQQGQALANAFRLGVFLLREVLVAFTEVGAGKQSVIILRWRRWPRPKPVRSRGAPVGLLWGSHGSTLAYKRGRLFLISSSNKAERSGVEVAISAPSKLKVNEAAQY